MQNKITFSDTTSYQNILENLMINLNNSQLNFENGIIAWFNNNEGFVAFLGVIASFVVSVTAIVISVLTYRSQKKEQTKNAQENAKLQKELTKQQNKFQADLQLRQIKIDSFNLRFKCLTRLNKLAIVLDSFDTGWDEDFKMKLDSFYFILAINKFYVDEHKNSFEKCFIILNDVRKVLLDVIKYKFVLIQQHRVVLNELLDITLCMENELTDIRIEYIMITDYSELEKYFVINKDKIKELGKKINDKFSGYDKKIRKLMEEVEKDLDISELHKISNE